MSKHTLLIFLINIWNCVVIQRVSIFLCGMLMITFFIANKSSQTYSKTYFDKMLTFITNLDDALHMFSVKHQSNTIKNVSSFFCSDSMYIYILSVSKIKKLIYGTVWLESVQGDLVFLRYYSASIPYTLLTYILADGYNNNFYTKPFSL